DYVREGGKVGVGIVEYNARGYSVKWENYVKAIHSIYIDANASNIEIATDIFKYVRNTLLNDDERAIVQMCRYNKSKGVHSAYSAYIDVQGMSRRLGHAYHAELLARDALKRKSTITETFDEYMQFSVIKQEQEERDNDRD